jgi:hypothetical protein
MPLSAGLRPQPNQRVGAELASALVRRPPPAPGGDKLLPYRLCCACAPRRRKTRVRRDESRKS